MWKGRPELVLGQMMQVVGQDGGYGPLCGGRVCNLRVEWAGVSVSPKYLGLPPNALGLAPEYPGVSKNDFYNPMSISLRRTEVSLFVLQAARVNGAGSKTM